MGGCGRRAPTAQYGELARAKPQARARVPEVELARRRMSVSSALYALPQTACSSGRFRGDFRPLHPLKTDARRRVGWVGG